MPVPTGVTTHVAAGVATHVAAAVTAMPARMPVLSAGVSRETKRDRKKKPDRCDRTP